MKTAPLTDVRLGLSVSSSLDLGRLGLVETHLRLTLGEVARALLVADGGLVYGGHLEADGYTAFLRDELQTYARRDRPLLSCLAWPVHRRMTLSALRRAEDELGLSGRIVCLAPDGRPVEASAGRGEEAPAEDPALAQRALTGLRVYMTSCSHARLLLGGRRSGSSGRMPGLLEEALLAIEARQPLFLAGGFGGATADACRALGLSPPDWPLPPPTAPSRALDAALLELTDAARRAAWRADLNGLDANENARLAASHRPSDVASLVALGLGRLRSARQL